MASGYPKVYTAAKWKKLREIELEVDEYIKEKKRKRYYNERKADSGQERREAL